MSWLLNFKKYKKKLKELLYYRSELEYQNDVLSTAHRDFETYYLQYCANNGIDLKILNETNREKVNKTFEESEANTNALIHKSTKKSKDETKVFNPIYKEIAKKVHPDKLSIFLPKDELEEKEGLFKQAATAMDMADWGKLLEVADRLNIKPKNFDGMEAEMDAEINKIKLIKENNENMLSWIWYQCEDDDCRDEIVRNFLFTLFGFQN